MEFEQIKHKTMKIVVSKTSLEKAVKNIAQVINKKCALPILGDIHFKCYTDNTAQTGEPFHYIGVTGSDSEHRGERVADEQTAGRGDEDRARHNLARHHDLRTATS